MMATMEIIEIHTYDVKRYVVFFSRSVNWFGVVRENAFKKSCHVAFIVDFFSNISRFVGIDCNHLPYLILFFHARLSSLFVLIYCEFPGSDFSSIFFL